VSSDPAKFISDVFSIRLGDAIASVGEGVASAQMALDKASIEATLAVYASDGDEGLELLRSIGYQPNFYGVRNVKSNMKIAMQFSVETTQTQQTSGINRLGHQAYAMPVNATTQNKYGYSGTAATELSFEIVPLPPQATIRRAPDLIGKSITEARSIMNVVGLDVSLIAPNGETITEVTATMAVTDQSPAAGTIVSIEQQLVLTVA
jgi:PASTA domain